MRGKKGYLSVDLYPRNEREIKDTKAKLETYFLFLSYSQIALSSIYRNYRYTKLFVKARII